MQIPRQVPEFPLEARLDMALGAAPVRRGPAPPAYPEAFNITLDEPAQPPAPMRTLTPIEARQVALGRDFAPAGYSPGGRPPGVTSSRGPFTGAAAPARTQGMEQQIPYRHASVIALHTPAICCCCGLLLPRHSVVESLIMTSGYPCAGKVCSRDSCRKRPGQVAMLIALPLIVAMRHQHNRESHVQQSRRSETAFLTA